VTHRHAITRTVVAQRALGGPLGREAYGNLLLRRKILPIHALPQWAVGTWHGSC
jgi:hypothetical protein